MINGCVTAETCCLDDNYRVYITIDIIQGEHKNTP